jgi:hypothetical protein
VVRCLLVWIALGWTLDRARWLLRVPKDQIGSRPIGEIEPPELLDALRNTEARGHHETVSGLRSHLRRFSAMESPPAGASAIRLPIYAVPSHLLSKNTARRLQTPPRSVL